MALFAIAPTIKSVDKLPDEDAQLAFVTQFRELLRLKNVLTSFADYKETDLTLEPQKFEDYKSKYLDINDSVKKERTSETPSVLDNVDFELSLIHRDEINVAYILNLLRDISRTNPAEAQKRRQEAIDQMTGEIQLRSKRALIEEFIEKDLSNLAPDEDVTIAFENYWLIKKAAAFNELCTSENLQNEKLEEILKTYNFANRLPRDQEITDSLNFKPKILARKTIIERVSQKITDFIDTFIEGMGGTV
ncbi:MAG: hypothetical protein LH649_08930 [Pseudanabaena sp. CAN_BIN31]|nr:hypothetical protein [Pseudanabaena sp. CAN_BIN31]